MTYSIAGYSIVGRIVGRSHHLDGAGRRCYLLLSRVGNVFLVSGDLLREV